MPRTYDANGNLLSDGARTYTYDAENRLASVTSGSTTVQFAYDADGKRIKKVEDGWVDFEMAIATPDMMPKIGRLGKVIGRRGLMPNPKSGTVVAADNLLRVIQEARQGRVEFRLDRTAIIHVPLGKVSFEEQKLLENLTAVMEAVTKAKPSGAKGQYIRSASLPPTMGPGLELDLKSTQALAAG